MLTLRRHHAYTTSPIDRASHLRDDEAWIAGRLADPDTLVVPVWRSRNLMRGAEHGAPEAVLPTIEAARSLASSGGPTAFLGLWQDGAFAGRAVFAVDLSAAEDPLPLLPDSAGSFVDLRQVAGLLPEAEAGLLAHARGLMHWRTRSRFCGVCGAACEPRSAGHALQCITCAAQHFPRTDPAVIMLVHRGDRALLAQSHRFPTMNMYSTLAGFVEPGESLEQAVAREVREETSVEVGLVRYHSSQPWPFPQSIMLGFFAEATSEAIVIEAAEIRDAGWFTRDEVRAFPAVGRALPRVDSIARRLIEDWLEEG